MVDPLKENLVTQLLSAIDADRRGKVLIPRIVVKGVIQSFVKVANVAKYQYNQLEVVTDVYLLHMKKSLVIVL